MPELLLPIDYVQRLILKVRGLQAREDVVAADLGSNATDDRMIDVLEEEPGDLSREEIREEIRGLGRAEQAELVALMWVGRGDAEPEEWDETLALADERRELATEVYLLQEPLVGDYWAEGLERLGVERSKVVRTGPGT